MLTHEDIEEIVESMRRRVQRHGGFASVTLSDAYEADHPDRMPSTRALATYWRETWAPENVAAAYEEIVGKIEDGRIRIWRHITIGGDDPVHVLRQRLEEGKGLNIYWSHSRDQAHSHDRDHSKDGTGYLLEATADVSGIDWRQTLASYAHPDWVGEDEITMLADAEVTLVSMKERGGWLTRTPGDEGTDVPLLDLEGEKLPVQGERAKELRP